MTYNVQIAWIMLKNCMASVKMLSGNQMRCFGAWLNIGKFTIGCFAKWVIVPKCLHMFSLKHVEGFSYAKKHQSNFKILLLGF